MCRPSHDPSLWMHSEKKTTMDTFLAFCPDHEKKNKLTSKKVYKPIPSIWPTFLQIHPRELLKLHFDMLLSFSLINFTETFMVSLNLYLKFFLLLTSEVFDKRSIRVRNESTWGLGMLQTIFKNYSRFRPSVRQFQGIKPCFHIVKKVQKDSANDYALKYIVAL